MARTKFDPQPPNRDSKEVANAITAPDIDGFEQGEGAPDDEKLLDLIGRAENASKDYHSRTIEKSLSRSYRAWQNRHSEGSKYQGPEFKNRSKLFVPKTRSAVRKNLAQAANALFSTEDIVNLSAQYDDDPQQRATAAVIKADLDYRLTRTGSRSGVPWFQISMGASLDSQLTGVCVSKQFWEYEEIDTGKTEMVDAPVIDPDTEEVLLDDEGLPFMLPIEQPVKRVTKDRPMSELHPIENIGLDPAAPWHSPVQGGRWFYCRFPMGLSDARALMKSSQKGGAESVWLDDISDETLLKGRVEDERGGSRRVREGGGDRYEDASTAGGDLDVIWIQENFIRLEGVDWHFWSVGRHGIISKVRQVHEAYPEFGGERPYVMGQALLDTHRVYPQSPVETWQSLQFELNDVTNLRLDTLKRSIAPIAKVKRGKNVDLTQVSRRGQPNATLLLHDMNDVVFEPTPGPSGAGYTETSITNSNFDELAGVFSTSSVQQSRQLNETVGGMSLMSRAANSVSEFDLRLWVETWVEPTLRQMVHLIRAHESDEKILAVAGQDARVWQKYQYMPTLEDFDQCEITVSVNAGIGSVDPIQKLQKLKYSMEMLAPIMPQAAEKGITLNVESLIEEVMGAAGYKDGRRFFEFGEPQEPGVDPETQKMMAEMKLEQEKIAAQKEKWMGELKVKLAGIMSGERQSAADNIADIEVASIKSNDNLTNQVLSAVSGHVTQVSDLSAQQAAEAQRYRMGQLLGSSPEQAQPKPAQEAMGLDQGLMNTLGQLLQSLAQKVDLLTQKVTQQDEILGGFGVYSPANDVSVMQ